jgi:hypothetical protein
MSQRNVELLIGRLVTDEDLRRRFARAPFEALAEFVEQGWELTRGEIDALVQVDITLWSRAAARLPSRLQRVRLCPDATTEQPNRR